LLLKLCGLLTVEAAIKGILKVIIGSLLHHLGVLQALYELKFLLLHHSNLSLDLKASLVLSDDPLLQLCASPRLLLSLVQTALLLRLELGIADLLFSTGCLQGLLLLE
jgi:hypothetical protein